MNLQVFACYVGSETPGEQHAERVEMFLDTLEREFSTHSSQIAICLSAAEAREIISSGKIAAFVAIENGMALENDLDKLNHFHQRGVRYLTLIHNESSAWCISANDKSPAFAGLTNFGDKVVERMNEIGMIVDVSHVHPLGVSRVLEVSQKPIIASHSCAHALCPHPRNLTDQQIRAISDCGGMVGVNFHGDFLSEKRWQTWRELVSGAPDDEKRLKNYYFGDYQPTSRAEIEEIESLLASWEDKLKKVNATTGDVVDHIDHLVKVGGVEHVGLGSDYDGIFLPPDGLDDVSQIGSIAVELAKRNYSETNIDKIMGENFLRVFAEVC